MENTNQFETLRSVHFKEGRSSVVYVNDTSELNVVYEPQSWTHKAGQWDCDNPDVVKIGYRSGLQCDYTALKTGTATITFTPDDNKSSSATCTITVLNQSVSSMKLTPSLMTSGLSPNKFTIEVEYSPDNGIDVPVWDYDNTQIALVPMLSSRKSGLFNVISTDPCNGKITASVGSVSAECNYFLTNNPINSVTIDPQTVSCEVGESFYLALTYDPTTADKMGIWKYDEEVFSLNETKSGLDGATFIALKSTPPQTASTISYICNDKAKAECNVTVTYSPVKSITAQSDDKIVKVPNGFFIDMVFEPASANKTGKWVFDEEHFKFESAKSTDTRGYFSTIKPFDSALPIYFQSSGGVQSNAINIVPDYSDLISIEFDPPSKEIKALDVFNVKVKYNPDTARHSGIWDIQDVEQYVKLSGAPQDDLYTFSSLKSTFDAGLPNDTINLTFDSGYSKYSYPCKIDYSDLISYSYTPPSDVISYDDISIVKVNYNPETAKHAGTWKIEDEDVAAMGTGTTADVGYVKSSKSTSKSTNVYFIPESVKEENAVAFNITVGYSYLDSVAISPDNGAHEVGEEFTINMTYMPLTAQHTGRLQWNYPADIVEFVKEKCTPDVTVFRALKPTTEDGVILSFQPDGVDPVNYKCIVKYPDVESISLIPPKSTLKPGDAINIVVSYDPDDAKHKGTWTYDMDKIAFLPSDYPHDEVGFYVLKNVEAGDTDITYDYGDGKNKAVHTCTIEFSNTDSVSITPSRIPTSSGSDFYVTVIYEPESAQHKGTWYVDETILEYQQDSTMDVAHFKVKDNAPTGPTSMRFVSTPINPDQTPPEAYATCFIIR